MCLKWILFRTCFEEVIWKFVALLQPGTSLQPPSVLLDFNPLAVYCNAILSAFNDLRLCAPISLVCDVTREVESSLSTICLQIAAYHRSGLSCCFVGNYIIVYWLINEWKSTVELRSAEIRSVFYSTSFNVDFTISSPSALPWFRLA